MILLLELGSHAPRTTPRDSTKPKPRLPGNRFWIDPGYLHRQNDCAFCNKHKGPNIAGIDPLSGDVVRLFHPRKQNWGRHFQWMGATLLGLTKVARATIRVLAINDPDFMAFRAELMEEGIYPRPK